MLFDRRNKKQKKCEVCGNKTNQKYSFCPNCGNNLIDSRKERENFGLLGKNDFTETDNFLANGFGISDRLFSSIFNSMMKQLKSQFKEYEDDLEKTEVKTFPNGIRIKISGPFQSRQKTQQKEKQSSLNKPIGPGQLKKINSLPREKAKTSVKRLGNRVYYELSTPGVLSPHDVFITKLESGYEVKAIGDKKVYVNSMNINLPLRKYTISNNKLLVEFVAGD